jgi:malate dehydrogenase (oxaloacetate-decarboxylating)
MEGKSILFNAFGGVEAFPICVATQDVDEIVDLVCALEPTFGGINLEDISAPRCFAIEERLQHLTDIPVFHDDQHGTAVVVLAGLLNALKLVSKDLSQVRVVMNGAGAAGIACTRLLMAVGVSDVILCDRAGAIYEGRPTDMNWLKAEMARVTNRGGVRGSLADALRGADVFIGVSAPGLLTLEMIYSMARKPIIFALANPTPEIMPDLARAAGASVVATGRSDFNNQVNNSLAFPGIFRGALDARVRNITDPMKIAAAHAIAEMVADAALTPDFIIPNALDYRVSPNVAAAVARCAVETGEARVPVDPAAVAENLMNFIYEGYLGPLEATGVEVPA